MNKACAALEEQNSALEGVLAGIDYNDERKLGDARNRDTVLARLVQHFSQVSLRNDHMAEPDLLGRAYEYLIEQFADDAGKKGGEFYTPRMVVKLIVELLAPTERMRICDPTAGSGGMLIECAHYIERHGGNPRNLTLHGQEKNLGTWAICKMNMLLHGLPDARIEKGDTICLWRGAMRARGRQPAGRRADHRRGSPLPLEEHLPQDGLQQTGGCGALRAVAGPVLTAAGTPLPPSGPFGTVTAMGPGSVWHRRRSSPPTCHFLRATCRSS